MKGKTFGDIVRGLVLIRIFLSSVCVGLSPCMPATDPLGRYTISGGSRNIWSEGVPSGSRVQVSVGCNQGAVAQPSVTTQCSNGTWVQPWPRCEKPCSVPWNQGEVRQFVNGLASMPITKYTRPTLPDGTQLVARCRDPGKARLIGDQRRTCHGGQWTGVEPQCDPVQTQVLFYKAPRQVASNGTVEVYVHLEDPRRLDVVCWIADLSLWPPRLTTPLVNDKDLYHWHWPKSHGKRLEPISTTTDFSGIFTCSGSSSSHSVHVIFKAAECEAPAAPEHGRLRDDGRQRRGDVFLSGARVSFVCDEGYQRTGSRRITCVKGEWSDVPPVCKVDRCPELTIPEHAIMEGVFGNGRNIGDERIFHCREGYILRGDTNNLRCLEDGEWSDPLPTCEAIVHRVSPCEGVRCASWERCVVTGPDTAVCGCINPSSCLPSGPTVCGTNGRYYRSECHLKAYACILLVPGLDIALDDDVCIYGVPEEDRTPTTQATEDVIPVDYSSSSFEVYENPRGVDNIPTGESPTQTQEDNNPLDYSSFTSIEKDNSFLSFESIGESSYVIPVDSTYTPPPSNSKVLSSEEGEN